MLTAVAHKLPAVNNFANCLQHGQHDPHRGASFANSANTSWKQQGKQMQKQQQSAWDNENKSSVEKRLSNSLPNTSKLAAATVTVAPQHPQPSQRHTATQTTTNKYTKANHKAGTLEDNKQVRLWHSVKNNNNNNNKNNWESYLVGWKWHCIRALCPRLWWSPVSSLACLLKCCAHMFKCHVRQPLELKVSCKNKKCHNPKQMGGWRCAGSVACSDDSLAAIKSPERGLHCALALNKCWNSRANTINYGNGENSIEMEMQKCCHTCIYVCAYLYFIGYVCVYHANACIFVLPVGCWCEAAVVLLLLFANSAFVPLHFPIHSSVCVATWMGKSAT